MDRLSYHCGLREKLTLEMRMPPCSARTFTPSSWFQGEGVRVFALYLSYDAGYKNRFGFAICAGFVEANA